MRKKKDNSFPSSRWDIFFANVIGTVRTLSIFRFGTLLAYANNVTGRFSRECPICNFEGYFHAFGSPPRWDARCTSCGSLERHRQFWIQVENSNIPKNSSILHFAPEAVISNKLRDMYPEYRTTDLNRNDVDFNFNIESIDVASETYDIIICMHVLEHVDTTVALSELSRITKPSGTIFIMVPIVDGLKKSYRNEHVRTSPDRELYFGQHDHDVLLGSDFEDMLINAKFKVCKQQADIESCVKFGLIPGETLFVCRKIS